MNALNLRHSTRWPSFCFIFAGLIAIIIVAPKALAGKIYKCTDKSGVTTYSQKKCADGKALAVTGKQDNKYAVDASTEGLYQKISDIERRFRCDTPLEGLGKFPSRYDLVQIMKDRRLYADQLTKKSSDIKKELGLKYSEKIPSGRACEYDFSTSSLFVRFFGKYASDGFISIDDMKSRAQQLGFPLQKNEGFKDRMQFSWNESGFRCVLNINDSQNEASTMSASCKE